MSNIHDILLVAIVAAVTFLTRVIPFILFPGNRKMPAIITYLSRVLPCAVIGMLVIYCLRSVSIIDYPYGIPELLAGTTVVLLYIWKRNTLISILSGTLIYMLMIQFVF